MAAKVVKIETARFIALGVSGGWSEVVAYMVVAEGAVAGGVEGRNGMVPDTVIGH